MSFDFNNPFIFLALGVAILIAATYYFFGRKHQHKIQSISKDKPIDSEAKTIPCVVVDSIDNKWSMCEVNKDIIDTLKADNPMPVLHYDGKEVYYLNRYKAQNGEIAFRTMESLKKPVTKHNSSHSLYNDLRQPEVKAAMNELARSDQKSLAHELMPYLPWFVAIFVVGFFYMAA